MVKSSNTKIKLLIDIRYMVVLRNSLGGNIFWSIYEKKNGVRPKIKGRYSRSLGSYFWGNQTIVTNMGPITLPSYIQVRIEQREIANKESNDIGGGEWISIDFNFGKQSSIEEKCGTPAWTHTYIHKFMPYNSNHKFSPWIFLSTCEVNLLGFSDIIGSPYI